MTAPSLSPERSTALAEALVDALGWDFPGEQDEPAPIFGCDTRVPSGLQCCEDVADVLAPLVARWLAEAWDEGHSTPHTMAMVPNTMPTKHQSHPADNPYRAALVPGPDHEGGK